MPDLTPRNPWTTLIRERGLDANAFARAINNATPEQVAEVMTRLTPEQEEIAREFEDMGRSSK